MRATQHGFTLIELVVVMIVLGVLVAVALPRLTDRRALQERGFLDQVASMAQHARKLATTQRRDVCVLLRPPQVRMVYANAGGNCNPATPVATPGGSAPFVAPVPAGVTIGGTPQLRFDPNGRPVPNADHVVRIGRNAFTVSRETGIVF